MSNKKNKKKNRIKYNRIRDFSDCSLLSWNNWKSFPKWNIYRSRVKRKTRRNHGGNFTTHLEDQAVYRYQRKFHHSANNSIPFLFFPFLFRSWHKLFTRTSIISTPLISPSSSCYYFPPGISILLKFLIRYPQIALRRFAILFCWKFMGQRFVRIVQFFREFFIMQRAKMTNSSTVAKQYNFWQSRIWLTFRTNVA